MAKELDLTADDESAEDPMDEVGEEHVDQLQELLTEFGSNAPRVLITQRLPRDKAGYLATWDTDSGVTLDRIAQEFGAGEFLLRMLNGNGKFIKKASRTIKISPSAVKALAPAALPVAVAAPSQGMGIGELLAFMQAQMNAQQSAQQAQASMQVRSMELTMQMMGTIMTAAMGRPSESLKAPDLVAMMRSMQEMARPPDTNAVDTLLKGLSLGRELGGDGGSGGETDFLGLAAKGLDVIGTAMRTGASSPAVPARNPRQVQATVRDPARIPPKSVPHPAPQVAQPAPAQGVQPVQPTEPKETTEMNIAEKMSWLKKQVNALVHQAKRESDPALYAAVFVDNLPESISEEEILTRFSSETALNDLAVIDPRVKDFASWFEEFRVEVLRGLSDEPEDEEDYGGHDMTHDA